MSHIYPRYPKCPRVTNVTNSRSVPNVPCVQCVSNVHVSHVFIMSHVSQIPRMSHVSQMSNVSQMSHVSQMSQVLKKALPILMENISAMANINHMGGESHLLWLPLCTQRWGHVGLLMSSQCVLSVCLSHSFLSVCPSLFIVQAVKHETLTQCWANVGPLSTTLSQHKPSIGLPCCVWRHTECAPASQTVGQH